MSAASGQSKSVALRVIFVFEYAQPDADWMMHSLIGSLRKRLPTLKETRVHGLFAAYQPGALRPQRLLNLVWVYLQVAAGLLFSGYDAVLVRSSPPGVQLWTSWWARIRGTPVMFWLMDYHPEMEARKLDRRGWGSAARFLRRIDADSMRHFETIITLDRAMARMARTRSGSTEVLEHPTWADRSTPSLQPVCYLPGASAGPLRLAYSGNLGAAHDLAAFGALLSELKRQRPVQLLVIGGSTEGGDRFRALAGRAGVSITTRPRVPQFEQLRSLFNEWQIDAGVVLLAEESAGLVSPSKFSGYINFGVPIVYVGPLETNAADVCIKFNGGFRLSNQPSSFEVAKVAHAVLDQNALANAAGGAKAAAEYFAALNQDSLATLLAPRLAKLVHL